MTQRTASANRRASSPARLSAWCDTCQTAQPCDTQLNEREPAATPTYRCRTCGHLTPNPVLHLRTRPAPA